jgi:hypothetical protein
MLCLSYSEAPLVFQCYCMNYVVDCLNHISLKERDWQAPKEKIYMGTQTISVCLGLCFGNLFCNY